MRRAPFISTWLVLGLAFLYLPIAILVAASFNDSRLLTVWTRPSLRWYAALLHDQALIDAALRSLLVATCAATLATAVGAAAGIALARLGRFRSLLDGTGQAQGAHADPDRHPSCRTLDEC